MINYDYFCGRCINYQFSLNEGLLCKLTQKKPDFIDECTDFVLDSNREQRQHNEQKRLDALEERSAENEALAPEKKGIQKGVIGGIIMIVIAIIWFFGGLAAGYIFFYPPILFIIGVYALIKGLFQGNFMGKPKNENPYQRKE